MIDQGCVDKIRKETYPINIYEAFSDAKERQKDSSILTRTLVKTVQEIYRYLEPGHFKGKLLVCIMFDDEFILEKSEGNLVYEKNILTDKLSETIVLQIARNEELFLWEGVSIEEIVKKNNALFYYYESGKENFFANNKKIDVPNSFHSSSIFSLQYHYLSEALESYNSERVSKSSCVLFQKCWYDKNRIFFKAKPEADMQESLKEYLSSRLRGVDVVREYTLATSKQVDIRVSWKEANRAALIEIKWLGKSKNSDNKIATEYTNSRALDGLEQLKEYIDYSQQDSPGCITKGYLVVIDGRRKGTVNKTRSINEENGLYYQGRELDIPEEKEYYNRIMSFEKPLRMFVWPICS